MIETLHLAMDENISQYACLISSVWPGGWLEVRNNHINTVMEVVPYYIPDTEDLSDTGSETLYEDEDEVEGSMFPEGWIAPIYRNFHHLDWYSKPAYHRNATPPEVSLWFARFASKNKSRSYDSLRSFVFTSQAGKLIDPVRYWGPPRFLEMPGTELCDSLAGTGAVEKAYRRWGTWDRDNYSSYEATPVCASGMGFWVDARTHTGPPRPYIIESNDCNVPAVNDDRGVHGPIRNRRKALPGKSRLCLVENADEIGDNTASNMRQEVQDLARALDTVLMARRPVYRKSPSQQDSRRR